jgi:cytochrome P450
MHLSTMEAKVLLVELFSRLKLSQVGGAQTIRFKTVPIWHPATALNLRFEDQSTSD